MYKLFTPKRANTLKLYQPNILTCVRGIILGIETSCDDTGCAIVNAKGDILGESLYSQHQIHLE